MLAEEVWDMSNRSISGTTVLGLALWFSLAALPVAGQVTNAPARSDLSRTPDGHPDLQGTYDLASMTPLERWPGDPPLLTKEQLAERPLLGVVESAGRRGSAFESLALHRPDVEPKPSRQRPPALPDY